MSYDRPRRGGGGGGNQGYQGGGGGGDRRDGYRGPQGDRGGNGHHGGGGYQNNYRGGGGGGGQPMHQRSFVGKKRGREEEAPEDPRKLVISWLMTLCDPPAAGSKESDEPRVVDADVEAFEDAVRMVKRDLMHKNHSVLEIVEILLDCAAELCTKTHVYALFIGLLNIENGELGSELLSCLSAQLSRCLASPRPADHDRARLLVRLLCCLAPVNVVHPSQVVALMERMVGAALAAAKSGNDPSGHSWQPWSDWLVYAALAVMPWAGTELSALCPAEVSRLGDTIEEYLGARPIQSDLDLRPFLQPIKEDDLAAKSDSGGASFLPSLWSALSATSSSSPTPWRVEALPSMIESTGLESKLAVAQPHELPAVDVPEGPPVAPPAGAGAAGGEDGGMEAEAGGEAGVAARAAFVRKCFPPRGGIVLLDPQVTGAGKEAAERFVAEECILDTLTAFDADRVACIKVLTSLPIRWPYTPLLAEVMFGQMLALPSPRLPLMSYATVMVDLCKFPRLEFPRSLSGCVRECFTRLAHMDPELPPRLVAFLSYHLSNFEFQWPWDRWEKYADEAESNPHRQFCQQLVARLVRLSYWERVAKVLPPKFKQLLGPPPIPPALPGEGLAPAPPTAVKPEADGEAQAGAGEGVQGSGAMEGVQEGAEDAAPPVPLSDVLAGEALQQVRARASCDALLAWLRERGVEEALGLGPPGPLQVIMRAVLAAGSKSPSHLNVALERYAPVLSALLEACADTEDNKVAAQTMLLRQAADFYKALPQKVLMVVDRLLALNLASAAAVAQWSTSDALPSSLASSSSLSCTSAWELLHYALDRTTGRVKELAEQRSKVQEEEAAARARATDLSGQAEITWGQLRDHMRAVKADAAAQAARAAAPPPPPPAAAAAAGDDAVMNGEGEAAGAAAAEAEEAAKVAVEAAAAEAAAGVDALSREELAGEAQQDPRGRRLVGATRDVESRMAGLVAKADQLSQDAQQLSHAASDAVKDPQDALLVAYRGLTQLMATELAAQEAGGDEDADGAHEARAARVALLSAQLRAFARRYACETAALAPRLADALGGAVPPQVAGVLREVLHADLLPA